MDKSVLNILSSCKLFDGANENDIPKMLKCLGTAEKNYLKNQIIFNEGDKAGTFGVILSGNVQIVKDDYYGNRNILAIVEKGELFAEAYACAGVETLPVSVIAVSDCKILMISINKILTAEMPCKFHNIIMNNLLKIVSVKNILLNEKAEITSKRTTQDKLIAYLSAFAKKYGSNEFDIPLNRQQLADYLCVERSAMSAEISKLKSAEKIECTKNHFKLLEN